MSKEKWYEDQDISLMLNHYSQDIYQTELPIKISHQKNDLLWLSQTINRAIGQIKNENIGCVAIPINLGNDHWTGLVLKKNAQGAVEAHYNNSLGTALEQSSPELQQMLLNNDIKAKNIHDYQIHQQDNGYDCGPWCVINMDAMARGEKLYNSAEAIGEKPNIEGQRELLVILKAANEDVVINDDHHHHLGEIKTSNQKPSITREELPNQKTKFETNIKQPKISGQISDVDEQEALAMIKAAFGDEALNGVNVTSKEKNVNPKYDVISENLSSKGTTPRAASNIEAIIATLANLSGAVLTELEKIRVQLARSVKYVKDHLPHTPKAPPKKQSENERKK